MKKLFALTLLAISTVASADSVIVNGTRFIYPSKDKEITVQLTNTSTRPALIQTWLDNGDPSVSPDDIVTPFSITPPITRVDGKAGQTLRIRALNRTGIATDRESLWWLNVLEIPPSVKQSEHPGKNVLMMAIRSRFKFIYRPVELGSASGSAKKLSVSSNGKTLSVQNPTPFYISISAFVKDDKTMVNTKSETIAPKSTQVVPLNTTVRKGENLTVVSLNDFGSAEKNVTVVK